MKEIIKDIQSIQKSEIEHKIRARENEFLAFQKKGEKNWFSELCFCLLTANSTAEKGIQIQNALGYEGFSSLSEKKLAGELKRLGHRFYNKRAQFIVEARHIDGSVKKTMKKEAERKRDWLVENIKGLGMKESSHFLRNVGYLDYAILDRHIQRYLYNNGYFEKMNMTPKNYLLMEELLEKVCKKTRIKQGTLDLYLWYKQTGKILK